jgi:hypothetical protein
MIARHIECIGKTWYYRPHSPESSSTFGNLNIGRRASGCGGAEKEVTGARCQSQAPEEATRVLPG